MKHRVGLIGVGRMGHGIARNIVGKGWTLGYLRHPGNQPTADLDDAGATGWQAAADMADACDVLILCVTGSKEVEDVLTGGGRVLERLRAGMVVIDCSTSLPASTVALAAQVRARGAHFVDAAMTRTPKEAEEGRLNLLVGGDPDVVASVRPLLSAFSETIFEAGGVGTGHQLKLLHNFVSLGTMTLIAEAVACGARGGVSMPALIDCLAKGSGGGVALERLRPYVLEGETAQLRFSVANAQKDIAYYSRMAADARASRRVADGVLATLDELVRRGDGDALVPEIASLLDRT
jgi:3-hydroxyisobutyrate dehydrogenase-like beta-hydroxyacid dehydrogenase